uniref:Nuclear receptor corepressor 1 n=1 Tax=Kalanchoe fedtschenkoi TaxID=63787 RepID=A0A7N0V6B2_KALFE
MPFPEPVPWDRKEIYRERRPVKSESLGSSPAVSRWRDSSSFSYRADGPREFYRRGSPDYRRPPGRGRQQGDWHMFPEEPGYGYMPSRSCERMIEDRSYWPSASRVDGRYRSGKDYYKFRGYQKDWEGHNWQQNFSSPSISAERPINSSPIFFGGKPSNGFSDIPFERRRNGMFPGFGADRHFNAAPVISGGRQSNGFSGTVNEKARNGFSPRNSSERHITVSPAVSGDKTCHGFSSAPVEKTRNEYSGAPVVKSHNRFSPSIASARPMSLSSSVSGDKPSDGSSCSLVVTLQNGISPCTATDRSNNMPPVVSKPCLKFSDAVVQEAHDGFSDAPTENAHEGFSPCIVAERSKKSSPSISRDNPSVQSSGDPLERTPNAFSSGSAIEDMPCHRLSGTSVHSICNGFSAICDSESSFKTSPVVSVDKSFHGVFVASSGKTCDGIAGSAAASLPQVNSDGKLSSRNASDCLQTGFDCVNEQSESSLKHQQDGGIGKVNELCTVPRHEKENFLGVDWKPLKWTRSVSLSSRGHSGNSRSAPVDSKEAVDESQQIEGTPLCFPAGDAADCVTSSATSEEAATRKKARLGWGQGLAKYEKKVIDDPCDNGKDNEIHIPRVGSECTSTPPVTPAAAYNSSPDNEHKLFKEGNISVCFSMNDSINGQSSFDKLDMSFITNEVHWLLNLVRSDDQCSTSASESNNAMCKLLSWKTGILKAVEMTDSEMESLESEIQSSRSEYRSHFHCPAASSSLNVNGGTQLNRKNTACNPSVLPTPLQVDSSEVRDDIDSPGTATSKPVVSSPEVKATRGVENVCIFSEDVSANSSHMMDELTPNKEIGCCPSISCDVRASELCSYNPTCPNHDRMDLEDDIRLCKFIFATNKEEAGKASDELAHLLSGDGTSVVNCQKFHNDLSIRDEIAKRKKLLRFTETAITLKYKSLQQLWKEDARLLEMRRNRPKSSKRLELGSRTSQYVHFKSNSSIRSRFSSPEGSGKLVPSSETISLTSQLLLDCPVKVYRDVLKMPPLILDEKEKQMSKFVSYNGLVEDPVALEKERALTNPWTSDEKETFLDKLALFGKDFRKIASYLDHKTIADCVEFYYKNHKSAIFERTRKKPVRFGTQSKPIAKNAYLLTWGDKWNQESAAAADVLAGICGSLSSEAVSSCVTSSFDHRDVHRQWKRKKVGGKRKRTWTQEEVTQNIEETCSGESCGEMDFSALDWTDEEKHMLLQAVKFYGSNFEMVSKYVKTRYRDECKAFYSKVKKRLGSTQAAIEVTASGIRADSEQDMDMDVRLAIPLPADLVV